MFHPKAAFLFLLPTLVSSQALGQGHNVPSSQASIELHVRVTYNDEQRVGQQVTVELLNAGRVPIQQTMTDSNGEAIFRLTAGGEYRIRVSGGNVQTTVSEPLQVDERARSSMVFMRVQRQGDSGVTYNPPSSAVTTAAALNIPSDARKSFDKGVNALRHSDYQKAAELFEKATVLYPRYDSAYDNLGVAYMRQGQTDKAQSAFEHAVQLNDKNPDADRNLARLLILERQYARAEQLLQKSLLVEPLDVSTLALFVLAQFQTGDYDGALQSTNKVHSLSHKGYAITHYVAARAYELKHQPQNASAEYETYLREDPEGAEAPQARSALQRLTEQNRPPGQ